MFNYRPTVFLCRFVLFLIFCTIWFKVIPVGLYFNTHTLIDLCNTGTLIDIRFSGVMYLWIVHTNLI